MVLKLLAIAVAEVRWRMLKLLATVAAEVQERLDAAREDRTAASRKVYSSWIWLYCRYPDRVNILALGSGEDRCI